MDEDIFAGPPGYRESLVDWLRSFLGWRRAGTALAPWIGGFGAGILVGLVAMHSDDLTWVLVAWLGAGVFLAVRYRRFGSFLAFYAGSFVGLAEAGLAGDPHPLPIESDIAMIDARTAALMLGFVLFPPAGHALGHLVRLLFRLGPRRPVGPGLPVAISLVAVVAYTATLGPSLASPVNSSFQIDLPAGWTAFYPTTSNDADFVLSAAPSGHAYRTSRQVLTSPYLTVQAYRQDANGTTSYECARRLVYDLPSFSNEIVEWNAPSNPHIGDAEMLSWVAYDGQTFRLGAAHVRQVGFQTQRLCYLLTVVVPTRYPMAQSDVDATIASFRFT